MLYCPASLDIHHSCHILPFQPILWNKYFLPEPANTAKDSPKSISEGGRIWQVCPSKAARRRRASPWTARRRPRTAIPPFLRACRLWKGEVNTTFEHALVRRGNRSPVRSSRSKGWRGKERAGVDKGRSGVTMIRSVFKISCLFLRPRPWQFEIRDSTDKQATYLLLGFETLDFENCDLKLWRLTVQYNTIRCNTM